MKTHSSDIGYLPAISVGTLGVFFLIWAAMHDIARSHGPAPVEFALLACCPPALALLARSAMRCLRPKERLLWLGATALLLTLFHMAAIAAVLQPKYARDTAAGAGWLCAGLPALAWIGHRLWRESAATRKIR